MRIISTLTSFEQITQSMVDRYHEEGFLVVREAFSPEDADCLSVHYEHNFSDELAKVGVNLESVDQGNTEDVYC